MSTAPDLRGLIAARRYAHWHIGDKGWANEIINAYLNPDEAHQQLDEEQG